MPSTSKRMLLHGMQNGRCHYCDRYMDRKPVGKYHVTEDHIIPKSEGGSDRISNLVGACKRCNSIRGSLPYNTFVKFVKEHGNEATVAEVLRKLTQEEYLMKKDFYDALRDHRESEVQIYRRPFMQKTRCYLGIIISSMDRNYVKAVREVA